MKKLLLMSALALVIGAPSAAYAGDHEGGHKGEHKGHKMFDKLDLNNDGEITKAEFDSFHQTKFTELDADGSGVITKDEIEAMKEKMKEHHEEHKGDTPAEESAE